MMVLMWCVVWRVQVLRIERVQNAKLWRRYCLKRDELVDARGEAGGLLLGGCRELRRSNRVLKSVVLASRGSIIIY
jgi:hypothetical protein